MQEFQPTQSVHQHEEPKGHGRPRRSTVHSIQVERASRLGTDVWSRMFHFYNFKRAEFLAHYHKQSNVETAFSMIKGKFGERLRSKSTTAQVNEALCKVLCHNLCTLIQSMYELVIDWAFTAEAARERERFNPSRILRIEQRIRAALCFYRTPLTPRPHQGIVRVFPRLLNSQPYRISLLTTKEKFMLKRLTRKLFTLVVLCAALTSMGSTPASSTHRIWICWDVPITQDCPSGYYCCDYSSGYCTC